MDSAFCPEPPSWPPNRSSAHIPSIALVSSACPWGWDGLCRYAQHVQPPTHSGEQDSGLQQAPITRYSSCKPISSPEPGMAFLTEEKPFCKLKSSHNACT
ncbi:unnamed protein product [Rangifer tarandus platyrhynchus]|uniref:Uncharacterized protein n=2 Tax=Rangifer tarandus platyrhynchus TaxID=3082113 RepID=A0AC60AA51_RANTA|nr:unnamed protein product [Rangifer tarandus platyrhynchus]